MGFDVDGVLTDGTLYFSSQGDEMKAFSSLDGHGLKMLQRAGIEVAIISGRSSRALELRAANLGIDELHMGVEDKRALLTRLVRASAESASPRRATWATTWSTCRSCAPADFPPPWPTATTKCSRPASTMSPAAAAVAAPCAKSAT
jgi:hypothetical protein